MSVRRSAFSFVTNNACTLEFVNHLGNCEEFGGFLYITIKTLLPQ